MSSRKIEDLYTPLQLIVRDFLHRCRFGDWEAFITDGYRNHAEQSQLYAIGRTLPGRKVTNARAGFSFHNFGLAIDCAFRNERGALSYDMYLMKKMGAIGKEMGFVWGGDWLFKDYPHFEWTEGLSIIEIRNGKRPLCIIKQSMYDIEFAKKHSGKIFLQVEEKGEAWWVNPVTLEAVFLGKLTGDVRIAIQAFAIGITNKDLMKLRK